MPQDTRKITECLKNPVTQVLMSQFNVSIAGSFPFENTILYPPCSMSRSHDLSPLLLTVGRVIIWTYKLSPPPLFPRGPTDVTLCRL